MLCLSQTMFELQLVQSIIIKQNLKNELNITSMDNIRAIRYVDKIMVIIWAL